MSELTYKKIIDVEQIDVLGEGTTLFVNDGGSMKQMDAAALGAVKSVNGVLPDENGAIESYHSVSFNFLDGSAVVPGLINYYGTETMAELCDYYASSGIYNVECRRIIMTSGDRARSRNCIGEEIVKDADGNVTGRRLFFGDDLCPVILDIASNKIIFDPDWVAPTPCVKTVNGIEPDENGDVFTEDLADIRIVDMTDVVPGRISMNYGNKSYTEILDMLSRNGSNVRGAIVSRVCLLKTGAQPVYTATAYDSFALHKMRIHFGDNICPLIIDAEANTVTLDPDWVKPEENAGGEMFVITNVYNDNTQEGSTTANMSYSELRAALVDLRAPLGFMKSMAMYEGETDWRFAQYSCANYELKEDRITVEYGDGGSWDYLEDGTIQQRPM